MNITSCSFSDCEGSNGGAIYHTSDIGDKYIVICYSSFINCSGSLGGGAVYYNVSSLTIYSNTFNNCSNKAESACFF